MRIWVWTVKKSRKENVVEYEIIKRTYTGRFILTEAKTCSLHEKYYYYPGNYKMTGDKFKGDSVSFSAWGYNMRDKDTKPAAMKLFTEVTGEKKFMDYISDDSAVNRMKDDAVLKVN